MAQSSRLQETHFVSVSQHSLANSELYFEDDEIIEHPPDKSTCAKCMTRIPYATLIATIMCILGVIVFCGTMYRGATLALLMFEQVFKLRLVWIEAVQMAFVVIGGCMGALGSMILAVGFLATGATRHKVYRAWGSRVSGRISCAIFMFITYILGLAWIFMFVFLVIVTFLFSIFWWMCDNDNVAAKRDCIDFTQFYFFFPIDHRQEHMKVCGDQDVKLFCKDYVEKAEPMFILASVSCILIILSLVHYLMCLAANYAHIRDHDKMQQIQELNILNEADLYSDKSRF